MSLERKEIIKSFMLHMPLSRRIIVKVSAAQKMPEARFLNKPYSAFGDVWRDKRCLVTKQVLHYVTCCFQ